MGSLIILILNIWTLSFIALLLHRLRPRFGAAPLLALIGGLTMLVQSRYGIYLEPFPNVVMFIGSTVFVPVILMCILILYVVNGSGPARLTILSVLCLNILMMFQILVLGLYLGQPGSGSIFGVDVRSMLQYRDVRVTLGSLVAYSADMFIIALVYQTGKNYLKVLPEWGLIGLTILLSLWTDSLLFHGLSETSLADFIRYTPGDLIGKTISAVIVWLPLAYYMTRIAPKMPDYVGASNRRTFDVLYGGLRELRQVLSQTEAALQQSETRRREEGKYRRQIFENINEAIWLYSLEEERVIYVNPAYERMWGLSASACYEDPSLFIASIHPEDRERVAAGLPRQQMNQPYDVEYRIVCPDGTVRRIRDRAFAIHNERGVVCRIVGIAEDMTNRYEAEKKQMELALEREKVKLLREFVSEVSHDLKSPLTTINLKLYQFSRLHDDRSRQSVLQDIQQLSARMSNMIADLLTLARLDHIEQSPPSRIAIQHLIQGLVTTNRVLLEEKQLQLELSLNGSDIMVTGDRDDLLRALGNLLDNAIRYTRPGGMIQIQVQTRAQECQVMIRDTGIGIPPDDLPHIFERFYRGNNVRANVPDYGSGTGLGLAIVKGIVDRQGGHIEVSSQPGVGTTFIVLLPLAFDVSRVTNHS